MDVNSAFPSVTPKARTGCGTIYITILFGEDGRPCHCIAQLGKSGGCAASQLSAIAGIMNVGFKHGATLKELAAELKGIHCPVPAFNGNGGRNTSCADAIAKALETVPEDFRKHEDKGESVGNIA